MTALPPPREDFVQLDRRFSELPKKCSPDDAADESYLFQIWTGKGGFDWEKLLKNPLIVILGEQGSGKSWEIEYQAARLAAEDQFAFYIRLEDLVSSVLTDVLGTASAPFHDWKSSDQSATFFLDSVDESKLKGPEAFHAALRRFREALPMGFATRAKIVVSSRVSEWHAEDDGARLREYFGLSDRRHKRGRGNEDDGDEETKSVVPELLVVQISPLEREQVATLAQEKGYPRVDEFLNALDEAHAWEFARRPIDVEALAGFWLEHGRIGSLTELIEFDLVRNLRERRAHVRDSLNERDARLGVEALAAGAVFCGEPNIRISSDAKFGTGLDGQLCLPTTFTRDQHDSLLNRAVFDGASFSRVRFHHRRVREYLAACWVNHRMEKGCSLAEMEGLFFDQIFGKRVLRASRAPVAVWLCAGGKNWNVVMRRWVLEAAPELPLRYGDPRSLPIDFKQAMLDRLIEMGRTRGHLWMETERDAMGRLADAALVPQIEAIISDRSLATDLRSAMLEIVRHGKLAECLPAALNIVAADEPEDLKVYAVAAIREINEHQSIDRLSQIAIALPKVSPVLTDLLIEALFPTELSSDDLVLLLRKTRDSRGRPPNLEYQIRGTLAERLTPAEAGPLLARLLGLLKREPHFPSERGEPAVSQEFSWLRPLLSIVLAKVLEQSTLTESEITDASEALTFLGALRERHMLADAENRNLQKYTEKHDAVRRGFFWSAIQRRRPLGPHAIDHPINIFSRYDQYLEPARGDVDWLIKDLADRPDLADREVALTHAMIWFSDLGRPWVLGWRIRRAIGDSAVLRKLRGELSRQRRVRKFKNYYYRFQHIYHHRRRQWGQMIAWFMSCYNWTRNHYFFWKNHSRIASGEYMNAVLFLLRCAERNNGNHIAVSNWRAADKKWGKDAVMAARDACKDYWRSHRQELPHECADSSSIPVSLTLGLSGLQAEWLDGQFNPDAMTNDEVHTATCYAMREINGFPVWFEKLAKQRPVQVGEVFKEVITGEWDEPVNRQRPFEGLQRMAWHAAPLIPQVRDFVIDRLEAGDPAGRALGLILGYLVRSPDAPLPQLVMIARSRLDNPATSTGGVALWFAVWLQINPMEAIDAWQSHVAKRQDADEAMMLAASALQDRDLSYGPHVAAARRRSVVVLQALLPLVFSHIKPADDINRWEGGAYTPGTRDHAQDFRNSLVRELADALDPTAADVLFDLSALPVFSMYRDRFLHFRDVNLKQQADQERWLAPAVRQFTQEHETDPQTDRDLFRIVLKRLSDVKQEVEASDLGWRHELPPKVHEWRLRTWLASKLIERSRQRYTVPQEAVIELNQRPDIRIEHPRAGYTSLELKWAQDWSFNELMHALEVQLMGQYLRAHNSRHGVLVLGMNEGGKRHWLPGDGRQLDFTHLLAALKTKAIELEANHPEAKRLEVIGIDFRNVNQ